MDFGALALRGVIGPLFVGHGTQKLFGWFGGHGPDGTGAFFESLGLRPGRRHALAAGATETVGGALLTAGVLTPVATSALTATMVTAIRKVHAPKGPWVTEGGWEYSAVLIGALTALAARKGPASAALSLGAGVAGSYLVTSDRFNAPAEPAGGTAAPAGEDAVRSESGRFARDHETPTDAASTPSPAISTETA